MTDVAFLGTGLIGAGMVEAMLGRGLEVSVWSRSPAKVDPLVALGARRADSPAEACGGAARVHLALSDDAAVDAVLAEAARSIPGGTVVVDHSTVSPRGVRARVERFPTWGFVHAPVFMSPAMCRSAGGIMVVSGVRERVARVEDELRQMTGKLLVLGERPDLAACFKLFGNAMIFAVVGGLADVLAMAEVEGVDAELALGLFEHFKPAGQIELRGKRMATGDLSPSFALAMARKDLGLMLDVLSVGHQSSAVLEALAARFDARIADGHGGDDLAAIGPKRAGG